MKKLSIKKQYYFFERIEVLLKASLSLGESLSFLANNEKDPHLKKIYVDIERATTTGSTLAAALHIHHHSFNPLTIDFISSGEEHGSLPTSIHYLCSELSKSQELRSKIINLCIYPSIILLMTLLLSGFLIVFIVPKIQTLFSSLDITLPISTRILIGASTVVRHYGIVISIAIVIIFYGLTYSLKRYTTFRKATDSLVLRLPVVGEIKKKYELARICRNIGTTLLSGLTLDQSLHSATSTTHHTVYREMLTSLKYATQAGISLSISLEKFTNYIPPLTHSLIAIAEKAGTLSDMFLYIGALYEQEVSTLVKKASVIAEPVLIALMGIIVGSIAIAIITPIYQITQHLKT